MEIGKVSTSEAMVDQAEQTSREKRLSVKLNTKRKQRQQLDLFLLLRIVR